MKKIIIGILGVIILTLLAIGLRFGLAYDGFLGKITEHKPELRYYSVIVSEKSDAKELKDLSEKSFGYLATDNKAGNAEQFLQAGISHESNFYDDGEIIIQMVKSDIIDAAVLEKNFYEIYTEEKPDVVTGVREIYEFAIEAESENVETSTKKITEEPFVVYISGSDSRAGIKATARSDVNIVAVVNPAAEKILLVSIPRDTYVQLHGTTGIRDKLTHAGVYGIGMSKATIEDFLGIKIDYTIKVSFQTVVKVVDEIGGIEIDSDMAMSLDASETMPGKICNYVVGKQMVDGDCALRFARERKSYITGDRHRGENQQQVISSIISKMSHSREYLLKVPTILDIAADSFETTFTKGDVANFLRMQIAGEFDWEVKSIGVDGAGSMQPTYSMGANWPLYVMLAYPESVESARAEIEMYLTNMGDM